MQEKEPPLSAPFDAQQAYFESVEQLYIECLAAHADDIVALDGLGIAFKRHAAAAAHRKRGALALELFVEGELCFEDALQVVARDIARQKENGAPPLHHEVSVALILLRHNFNVILFTQNKFYNNTCETKKKRVLLVCCISISVFCWKLVRML